MQNSQRKLVLVDGHAIIHRAYHALPPLTTRYGQPVNAVYGFASMLLKVIDIMHPSHIAIAFDLPVQTFRHETYIAYQSHRPKADDDLISQVQLVKDLVKSAGIAQFSAPGFEADDCLGTLAAEAVKDKFDEVVIVTGDRDILQLVNDKVKVYMPTKGLSQGRVMDEAAVIDYIGVKPGEIVEYKALVGDPSDNYPGVLGVGPKTAISLIKEFGTVENIYKKLDKIPEKIKLKLELGKEGAEVSHKLATIVCNVKLDINFEKTKLQEIAGRKEFIAKLKEYNFRSLYKRLSGEDLKTEANKVPGNQLGLLDN